MEQQPSAYLDATQKRLRTLKKRHAKVIKYTSEDPAALNKDQILAIDNLPMVEAASKELQDLASLFQTIDAEAKVKQTNDAAAIERKHAQDLNALQRSCNSLLDVQLQDSLKIFFVLTILLPNVTPSNAIPQAHIDALFALKGFLTGAEQPERLTSTAKETLALLVKCSDSDYAPGITFANLCQSINYILDPPPPPSFTTQPIINQVQEMQIVESQEKLDLFVQSLCDDSSAEKADADELLKSSSINFFNPSEVMGDGANFGLIKEPLESAPAVTGPAVQGSLESQSTVILEETHQAVAVAAEKSDVKAQGTSVEERSEIVGEKSETGVVGEKLETEGEFKKGGRGSYRGRGRGGFRHRKSQNPLAQEGGSDAVNGTVSGEQKPRGQYRPRGVSQQQHQNGHHQSNQQQQGQQQPRKFFNKKTEGSKSGVVTGSGIRVEYTRKAPVQGVQAGLSA